MAAAGSSDEWRAPPPSAPGSRPHQNEEYATVAVVDGEEFDITTEPMVMESVCPICHEDGTTKMQVQPVAFFHEMMVSSFECHSCGHKNVLVQPVGDIQETGVRCQLTVTCAEDLNREVVKGKDATVSIADLGFEIPPQTQSGTLSTVEGVLTKAVDGLRQTAAAIAESDPENAAKIREFLGRLVLYTIADEMVLPFTIILDDPTGNSFVQNFVAPAADPQLIVENYTRTDAQNKSLLILSDEQMYAQSRDAEASGATTGGNRKTKKTLAEKVGGLVSEEAVVSMYHGAKNSARLPCACPECSMPGENRMCITAIPHFAEIILMCFVCEHCGAKDAEVKHGGEVPKLGRRLTLSSTPETHGSDFSRDILKSEFARIEVCVYVPLHFKRILLTILTCPPHILTFKNVRSHRDPRAGPRDEPRDVGRDLHHSGRSPHPDARSANRDLRAFLHGGLRGPRDQEELARLRRQARRPHGRRAWLHPDCRGSNGGIVDPQRACAGTRSADHGECRVYYCIYRLLLMRILLTS